MTTLNRRVSKFMNNKLVTFFLIIISSNLYAQNFLGNLTSFSQTDSSVVFQSDSSSLTATFYDNDIIKFHLLPLANSKLDSSFIVTQNASPIKLYSLMDNESEIIVSTNDVKLEFSKEPFRLSVFNSSSERILSEPDSG